MAVIAGHPPQMHEKKRVFNAETQRRGGENRGGDRKGTRCEEDCGIEKGGIED